MTELTITPKIADKTARFKGAVAAGEHVAVTIKGGAAWLGDDNGEHLSLRVLDLVTGRTLAVFPRPPETLEEGDEPDEWSTSSEDPNDLFCNLNLNTDRMVNAARHMLRVPVLFVMGAKDDENPAAARTLYFRDRHEVEFWPERVGDDTPYDLDRWPKQIDEWTELIAEFETRIDTAEDSIRDAVDEANGIVAHVDAAKTAAQNSATAAGDSASSAQGSAATAKNWATGGGETGDPGATNNAKYYAQQAGDAKTDAAASATSAAASATAAANSATAASGSATAAASSAQSAAGAAEAAVETEKERAEDAESDLADAIDAEKERAEGAEALAIVNAEYNGTSKLIVFTTSGGDTKTIDASAFIKDGMISSVSVSNGNLVITFNSDAGRQPISIPLAQIFNPSNYYDKTAADGTFVKKDGAKVLSTNDYTTAEKQKLAGIDDGANAYVLPPATSSALGGVKQGTGCTIAPDGTLNVTGRGGETPIAPSTDPSALGKPADAKATGDGLAGKRGLDDLAVYESGWILSVPGGGTVGLVKPFPSANQWESGESVGDYAILHYPGTAQWMLFTIVQGSQTPQEVASVLVEDGDPDDVEFLDFGSGYSARFSEAAAPTSDTLAKQSALVAHVNDSTAHVTAADKAAWNAKQNALSAAQLANIAAVTDKADAADLRYRIAEMAVRKTLPAGCFPVTINGDSYPASSLVKESEASAEGDMYIKVNENGYSLTMVESPATGSELMSVVEVATFSSGGVFETSGFQDLQFGGVSPVADTSPTLADIQILADRTVNLITAQSGMAASIDIELPDAVTVDGVRYASDFILDVDNSANASDLALEFTGLGVDYAFVPLEDDSVSEMMTIGAGERVRLYFTETPYTATGSLPVINVARVTLGDFVTSTATQGGN